jgi:hypothetical protein
MSKNTYPLKLAATVKKAAAELAADDGVSMRCGALRHFHARSMRAA